MTGVQTCALPILLSLVVIPAVFTYFDDLQHWVVPRLKRMLTTDGGHTPVLPSAE